MMILNCVEKLKVDPNTVEHGVEGLMYLLTECSKLMVFHAVYIFNKKDLYFLGGAGERGRFPRLYLGAGFSRVPE